MASYCFKNNLRTRMWEVYLKRPQIFWTICCLFMLPLIMLTSPSLKLQGETSHLPVLTGVLILLIGLLGNIVFHWCLQICSKRVTVPVSVAASSADEVANNPNIEISILIDRSLVSIRNDLIIMHDLIKAMGREISCQPNLYNSEKGRRLWKHEDIYHVLKKNKGIEEIHGMSFDVSNIREIYLRPDMLEDMDNLKILKFYNSQCYHKSRLHILDDLRNFPEELRYFQWDGYPHRSVPLNSCAHNIVELYMPNSHMKQLWDGNPHLPNLKILNLVGCNHLIGIPDLSVAPNIRLIDVRGCTSLSQLYSSSSLPNLRSLLVNYCDALKTVNVGANKFDRRSWRLHADYGFFIWNRFVSGKVSMMIFKSESSKTYNFRFGFVSVPRSSVSESMDDESAVLTFQQATLKSVLPNLRLLRLLDNPSSLGSLSQNLVLRLDYLSALDLTGQTGILRTFHELEATESLCSPCLKGTGNKEIVLSWDLEDLIGVDDNLMENNYICNCRLSKIPSNFLHGACLTQVTLHRSDIVTLPTSTHSPSSLNSVLLSDCRRTQFMEFTFSLGSEIPVNVSEISFKYSEQQNFDTQLVIISKFGVFYYGGPSLITLFLHVDICE
ncbi:hypothetical protein L6164_001438 [Bauhinia variegata]|uniref:Uncharacterized protein n=1 Tax=Bauhinia variegata TaxID=167791 RepID=A0ACB9Q9R0_BAUVA|nr:hypothetical protein L6164_001438 [Bauhinia variegata]